MKLYFMKQNAVDTMKANMRTWYINYYKEKNNQWIQKLFDYDPFELFMEVPDFQLASLTKKEGEMELENCKILYEKLIKISDSQASDERLWAGLCNGTFYEYVRKRWKYDDLEMKDEKTDEGAIISRFFYQRGISGRYRNTLSKCWWVGHNVYQENEENKFALLDALGAASFSTKVSDIFYNYTFTYNRMILSGIIKGWRELLDQGYNLSARDYLRPALKHINALGGGILLDVYSEEEIKKIMIDYVKNLYRVKMKLLAKNKNGAVSN